MSDIDRKKAEVRARLEAQAAGKKAKKGFMTPERKKKLRVSSSMTNYVYHCHCHYQLPLSLMNIEKLTKYCQIQPPIQLIWLVKLSEQEEQKYRKLGC